MTYPLDHLTIDELRELAESALDGLPPSRRRELLGGLPAPPAGDTSMGDEDPTRQALAAIERTLAFLDTNEEELAAMWADDWYYDGDVERDLDAMTAELVESLASTCERVRVLAPSKALRERVEALLDALDDLGAWQSEWAGVPLAEVYDPGPAPDMLRAWLFATEPGVTPAALVRSLIATWPHPHAPNPLSAAMGPIHEEIMEALVERADDGNPAAARWLAVSGAPRALERYRTLAPDLGTAWALSAEAREEWDTIVRAAAEGTEVPAATLYRARVRVGRFDEAYADLFPLPHGLPPAVVWDDAVAARQLDSLRAAARCADAPHARWIGREESELLELPEPYDHDRAKAVVAYATARATRGELASPVGWCALDSALAQRLATAPGSHDAERCVDVALTGYEAMIAFHVRAKSRSRYARAAAYWGSHAALAGRFGLEARRQHLHQRFATELKRLPAFRDEMRAAGNIA